MGVIDMVNGKLCETLPIEEIEQMRNEGYEQGRADYAKEISANFDEMDRTAYRMGRADGIMQGRADAIEEINNREKNIPYSDFARGFKSGYEKGQMIIAGHDKQIRADVINAIKNDLHNRLTEEMNKPYQDQGLCQGLYFGIQRCDWYLDDSKEQKNE